MKLIALLPFKNEEWILPTYLSTMTKIADLVIAIDDGSTDNSKLLIEKSGGIVYESDIRKDVGWAEHHIRERLLDLGRLHGGTHFICLDADESFTTNFIYHSRKIIAAMNPGQKLSMHWLALWKSAYFYRNDDSVWSENYKDFVFCDDGVSRYNYAFLGVGRTPGENNQNTLIKLNSSDYGGVLHFQFSSWNRFQLKQAWYRCSELINKPDSVVGINEMYKITLEDSSAKLTRLPMKWIENILMPDDSQDYGSWHLSSILSFFDKYGVVFFEPLHIWHIERLRKEFFQRMKRNPKLNLPRKHFVCKVKVILSQFLLKLIRRERIK
jgi:glycosyltransferase involved in cell wall biosynthesis